MKYLLILILICFCADSIASEDSTDMQVMDTTLLPEAVIVEFPLQNIPGNMAILSGKNLNLLDGINIASTLNTIPGVIMQSGTSGTNRIIIRGMGSRSPYNTNRIKAYLNDVPITTADGLSTPEELDFMHIARVEVIKGPSSALYGSGLGGSINLYTPSQSGENGNIAIQYGSFQTVKMQATGMLNGKNINLFAGISHMQSEGYRENSEFRRSSFISSGEWNGRKTALGYLLLLVDVNGKIPSSLGESLFRNNPESAAPNWLAIQGFEKYSKGVASVYFKNSLSTRISNKLILFSRWNDGFERRPFNNLDDQSASIGIRQKITFSYSKADIQVGLEWILEKYSWELHEQDTLLADNAEIRNQLNIFSIFYYRLTPDWLISLAGTLNNISYSLQDNFAQDGNQSGDHKFPLILSPRFGISYSFEPNFNFYAMAGHGFSMPTPEETLLPEGVINTRIKPEQGYQSEIGSRIQLFNQALKFELAIYWIELKDLLVNKRVAEDIFMGINAGRTRHQGIEFSFINQLSKFENFPGRISSEISYTYSKNTFIEFTDDTSIYDGNVLPGIPDHLVRWQLNWYPFSWLTFNLHNNYTGMQYLNDSNSYKYKGYLISNIKIKASFLIRKTKTLEVFAGINNLYDIPYASMLVVNAISTGGNEPRYFYPGFPRHGYGGLIFNF